MGEAGSFRATEGSAATGVQRAKWRDSRTEDQCTHQPKRLVCSPAGAGGGWELRSQGEDRGWLREHNLKGASAPQLAGRESGKKSGAAEETRDRCFGVHEERGFRAPPKRAPETGASHGYQHRHQRPA